MSLRCLHLAIRSWRFACSWCRPRSATPTLCTCMSLGKVRRQRRKRHWTKFVVFVGLVPPQAHLSPGKKSFRWGPGTTVSFTAKRKGCKDRNRRFAKFLYSSQAQPGTSSSSSSSECSSVRRCRCPTPVSVDMVDLNVSCLGNTVANVRLFQAPWS